jgi:hypothetical protein
VPTLATAAHGGYAPYARWLRPTGVGWPKAEVLCWELGQGLLGHCGLGLSLGMAIWVRVLGHPRVFDPTGAGAGAILHLWVHPNPTRTKSVRVLIFTRG